MTPLKVLHVMTRLPVGGVENQLLQVLRHYDRTRVSPVVCSLADRGTIGREIEAEGIEVVFLDKLGHRFDYSIVQDIARLITERGVSVVRTHQYHANLYGRLGALRAGAPCVVASVHNLYTRDRKFHRRLMNRYLAWRTDHVVTVSDAVRRDVIRYDGISSEKVSVIRNGVDVRRFRDAHGGSVRRELGLPSESVVIGTVGRLTAQKGHRYLLDAFAVLARDADVRLLVVGDGPLRGELEERARAVGVEDRCIFTGTRRDIPEILAAMDVFVLYSAWEGLPNALLEAMAARRPVVASDIPPFREVLGESECGLLVSAESSDSLVRGLRMLVEDGDRRSAMGCAAGAEAAKSFAIAHTVDQYMALFESILESKGITAF